MTVNYSLKTLFCQSFKALVSYVENVGYGQPPLLKWCIQHTAEMADVNEFEDASNNHQCTWVAGIYRQ